MYQGLNVILTCPDLVRAGCAASRQPWVPLLGVQNRPGYFYLGLYFNLGLVYPTCSVPEPFWHSRRGSRGSKPT